MGVGDLKIKLPNTGRREPLWKGPEVDGVTFSLLSRFLVCRERFRAYVVEGLSAERGFNHRLEFGNMWHICEECLAAGKAWEPSLTKYCRKLAEEYFTQQAEISNWMGICMVEFPEYVKYWKAHPDVKDRTPLLQESVFNVPHKLPSGRIVRLKGKWDSVDLIGKGSSAGVYLQENKTKSDPNPVQIQRQLTFDLQTMMYLVALAEFRQKTSDPALIKLFDHKVCGVRYNVVKRPRQYQGKKESQEDFLARLRGIISDSPQEFFMRWKVEVTPDDINNFRRKCLDPILEQLCWWYEETVLGKHVPSNGKYPPPHWQHPFGVWNVLDEGGSSDLDEYLRSGSEVGLHRVDTLFPELEGG